MARNAEEFRFAVADPDGALRSSNWKVLITKSGIYLGPETMGTFKISIHTERDGKRVTNYSVTGEYLKAMGAPQRWSEPSRHMRQAAREPAPAGNAYRAVVAIAFPEQHLAPPRQAAKAPDLLIPSPPVGTYAEFIVSVGSQLIELGDLAAAGLHPFAQIELSDGETAQFFYRYRPWPTFMAEEFGGKTAEMVDFPLRRKIDPAINRIVLTQGVDDIGCMKFLEVEFGDFAGLVKTVPAAEATVEP